MRTKYKGGEPVGPINGSLKMTRSIVRRDGNKRIQEAETERERERILRERGARCSIKKVKTGPQLKPTQEEGGPN